MRRNACALKALSGWTLPVLLYLSSADYNGALNYNSKAIKKAKNNNIKIYMVLIGGNEERKKKCKKIAKRTGGKYYYVGADSDIDKVMKKVSKHIFGKKDTTDSDYDGLYDVFETKGVMGINGQKYSSNPYSVDTDGDKLKDGYELTGKKTVSKVSVKKVTVKYDYSSWISVYAVVPKSNPKKKILMVTWIKTMLTRNLSCMN